LSQEILNRVVLEEVEHKVTYKTLFSAVIFMLEHSLFAINLDYLQEIIFLKDIFRVPNTNERLLGLINLRGSIIPVFSLKLILGMEDHLKGKNIIKGDERYILIIKYEKDLLGFVVDSIYKNIDVTELNYRVSEYIKNWSENLLFDGIILDEDKEIFTISVKGLIGYLTYIK